MIAREKIFLLVDQYHVTARMSGNWNDNGVVIKRDCFTIMNYMFDSQALRAIISVHDAFTRVTIGEPSVISDIIFMREKHLVHATHRVNFLHELGGEPRRVDQNISALRIRPNYQVAPCPKTRFGIEAAIVNILGNQLRKCIDPYVRVVMLSCPN